jgi:hypothetical protein
MVMHDSSSHVQKNLASRKVPEFNLDQANVVDDQVRVEPTLQIEFNQGAQCLSNGLGGALTPDERVTQFDAGNPLIPFNLKTAVG